MRTRKTDPGLLADLEGLALEAGAIEIAYSCRDRRPSRVHPEGWEGLTGT